MTGISQGPLETKSSNARIRGAGGRNQRDSGGTPSFLPPAPRAPHLPSSFLSAPPAGRKSAVGGRRLRAGVFRRGGSGVDSLQPRDETQDTLSQSRGSTPR